MTCDIFNYFLQPYLAKTTVSHFTADISTTDVNYIDIGNYTLSKYGQRYADKPDNNNEN